MLTRLSVFAATSWLRGFDEIAFRARSLFEPVVMEVRHGPPDSGGESMTWIVRIRPSARSCRARVPLCQSYHQRAPRSPLYSPESGAEPPEKKSEDVIVEGSMALSVPPP